MPREVQCNNHQGRSSFSELGSVTVAKIEQVDPPASICKAADAISIASREHSPPKSMHWLFLKHFTLQGQANNHTYIQLSIELASSLLYKATYIMLDDAALLSSVQST